MADEDELLKAAADDIYRQLAGNPGIGIPVDPDMVDFLGLSELPPELADGDGSEFLATDGDGDRFLRVVLVTPRAALPLLWLRSPRKNFPR